MATGDTYTVAWATTEGKTHGRGTSCIWRAGAWVYRFGGRHPALPFVQYACGAYPGKKNILENNSL